MTEGAVISAGFAPRCLIALGAVAAAATFASPADAHRSGCHRWHTCPSDHHTYRWGAKGLLCTSYSYERSAADKTRIVMAGRTYWCQAAQQKGA